MGISDRHKAVAKGAFRLRVVRFLLPSTTAFSDHLKRSLKGPFAIAHRRSPDFFYAKNPSSSSGLNGSAVFQFFLMGQLCRFPVDDQCMKSAVDHFKEMYGFTIQYTHFPCLQTVQQNAYDEDLCAKEFGIKISEKLATVEARVLPAPWAVEYDYY